MTTLEQKRLIEKHRALQKELAGLRLEVAQLKETLEWFKRQTFGTKSERFISNDGQCELDLGVDSSNDSEEDDLETINYKRRVPKKKNRSGHGRKPWPENLRRETREVPPDFDTTGMVKIRDEVTETLQYRPPEFWVLREVRGVYVPDGKSESDGIFCPPLPKRPIDKGSVGAGVIAQLLVDKCTFHLPLYRIGKQWEAAAGIQVPPSDLYDWFAAGAFWFEAIRWRMLELIIESGYVQLDESTIRVRVEEKKGKCHLGNMLVVHSPLCEYVAFTYRESKDKHGPGEVLGDSFGGILQTDGAPAYLSFASGEAISHAGCHAHARRYFKRAHKQDAAKSEFALGLFRKLFAVERQAKRQELSADKRLALRQEKSQPYIDQLKTWLNEQVATQLPKGKLGKAIKYAYNHWDQLTLFLSDGRIELSNNQVENVIRLLALGRNNYLFAGSVQGAKNLATVYSIMATCRHLGINPYDYCRYLLEQLPKKESHKDIDDLLPVRGWKLPESP